MSDMDTAVDIENLNPEAALRSPLKDLNGRRHSTCDPSLGKRFTIRSVDHDTSNHAAINAQREVKRLKSHVQEKDRQLAKLEHQLHITKGQLEEMQLQELKHRNASKEIKKQLSSQETSARAKSAALARVSGQLRRISEMEESRSRRKTLQIKELNAEFERMEESYCSQLCSLEEEISSIKAAGEESAQAAKLVEQRLQDALEAQQTSAREREEMLGADSDALWAEKTQQAFHLEMSAERAFHLERELERAKCLHQVQLLGLQRQYESLFNAATSDTQNAMLNLTEMQSSIKEEFDKQSLNCSKLYQQFEEQREEKIDAQLRVVSLVTDLGHERCTSARLRGEIKELNDDLIAARKQTEELRMSSDTSIYALQEQILSLDGVVAGLKAAETADKAACASLREDLDASRFEFDSCIEKIKQECAEKLQDKNAMLSELQLMLRNTTASHEADIEKQKIAYNELSEDNRRTRLSFEKELSLLSERLDNLQHQLKEEKTASDTILNQEKALYAQLSTQRIEEHREYETATRCFQSTIDELKSCLQRETSRYAVLEDKNALAEIMHNEMLTSWKESHADLQKLIESERDRFDRLLSDATEAKEKLEYQKSREKSIGSNVINALKLSNKELVEQLRAEKQQHAVVVSELEARIAKFDKESVDWQQKYNLRSSEFNSLSAQMSEMISSLDSERTRFEEERALHATALVRQHAAHADCVAAMTEVYETNKLEYEDRFAALSELADNFRNLLAEEQKSREQIQRSRDDLITESSQKQERFELMIKNLQAKMNSTQESFATQVQALKQELADVSAQLDTERAERSREKNALLSENATIKSFMSEAISGRDVECKAHREAADRWQQKVADLEDMIQEERLQQQAIVSKALEYNAVHVDVRPQS